MKKTRQDYIKIVLTIAIIVGLFMPYVFDVLPIDVLFENLSDMQAVFGLTIPVLVTIPYLLLIMFKEVLKDSTLKVMKVVFLILYVLILADYCYGFDNSFGSWLFDEFLEFSIAILSSLILFILSIKYSVTKSEALQHILLAIMAFPMILYFIFSVRYDLDDLNIGGYIISGSFFALYIISIYDIFKYRSIKKQLNK